MLGGPPVLLQWTPMLRGLLKLLKLLLLLRKPMRGGPPTRLQGRKPMLRGLPKLLLLRGLLLMTMLRGLLLLLLLRCRCKGRRC